MNLSQPSVSRIVAELEARLGVKLLLRTTRHLTLKAAGAEFMERAREILAELDDAEHATRGVDSFYGTLRLALPVVFGTRQIIPRLPEFLTRNPLLRIELLVSDDRQNLIAEGVNLAVRMGELRDSAFGVRKLVTLQRLVVAAPSYLAARGVPKTPAELARHDCIFGPRSFGRYKLDIQERQYRNFGGSNGPHPYRLRTRHVCQYDGRIGHRDRVNGNVRR